MELTFARRLAALALLLHLGIKLHSPVSVELDAFAARDFRTELNRKSIRVVQSEQFNARQSVFDKFTQVPHALKECPRERFFFFHERDNNFIAMLGNFWKIVYVQISNHRNNFFEKVFFHTKFICKPDCPPQ